MKKILFTLLFIIGILFGGGILSAQDNPNEFFLGYGPGLASMQSAYETTNDIFNDVFSGYGPTPTSTSSQSVGIFAFGYNRFVSNKIKLGLSTSFTSYHNTQDYTVNGEIDHQVKWTDNFWSVLLRGDFHYVKKDNLTMYSGIAVGACFISSNAGSGLEAVAIPNNTVFAFHVNAFGIRVGRAFGFFAEAGFGYNSMLTAGFNVRF